MATVHPDPPDYPPEEERAKLPPPDGAISTCRHCSNEVMYVSGHARWEHTGHGHNECFQPHRQGTPWATA